MTDLSHLAPEPRVSGLYLQSEPGDSRSLGEPGQSQVDEVEQRDESDESSEHCCCDRAAHTGAVSERLQGVGCFSAWMDRHKPRQVHSFVVSLAPNALNQNRECALRIPPSKLRHTGQALRA